jgi:co-chaperonin GroES (HSP10)
MDGANLEAKGGIILPESAEGKASKNFARIMALGDGDKAQSPALKAAFTDEKRIIINGVMIGMPLELNGKKYRMVSSEDILAVL